MILVAAGLVLGYLLGSIPFAVLLSRALGGFDVTRQGTRNPGATNVFKNVGRIAGAAVGLLDYLKALLPALAAERWLGWDIYPATALAVGAVLGHDFSFALRFKGGKGGAATLGVFSYLDFPALVAVGALWALSLPFLRGRRFVAGPLALTLFPVAVALHASPWGDVLPAELERPHGALPAVASAALSVLLWLRLLPGLREARAMGPPGAARGESA